MKKWIPPLPPYFGQRCRWVLSAAACILATQLVTGAPAANAWLTTPPTVTVSTVKGDVLSITFNALLDESSVPDAASFSVTAGSDDIGVDSVAVKDTGVGLALSGLVLADGAVQVTYTAPLSNGLRGANGVFVASFANQSVVNASPPHVADAEVEGSVLTLTYDVPLDTAVPASSSYLAEVSLIETEVTSVDVIGSTVRLTLGSAVQRGQDVSVSYMPPLTSSVQSVGGSEAEAFEMRPARNTTSTTVPQFVRAHVDRTAMQIEFSEHLDSGSLIADPARHGMYQVRVDAQNRTITDEWIEDNVLYLMLESPVSAGQAVSFAYSGPDPANVSLRYLQDLGGARVPRIGQQSVDNRTTVPVPELWDAHVDGTDLVLVFSRELDATSLPQSVDFAVAYGVSDTDVEVSAVSIDSSRLLLGLSRELPDADTAKVSYTPAPGRPIRDLAGAAAAGFSSREAASSNTAVPLLAWLAVDNPDRRLMYPRFHPDTSHYALRCAEDDDIELRLQPQVDRVSLVIEGQAIAPAAPMQHTVSGVSPGDSVVISLDDTGETAVYVLHCIHQDFPFVTSVLESKAAATTELISLVTSSSRRGDGNFYLMILNKEGVPLFYQRLQADEARQFKYHSDGKYPFSYFVRSGTLNDDPTGHQHPTYTLVVLGSDLSEVDKVDAATVTGIAGHITVHDAVIRANGNYVLVSYPLDRVDLSGLTGHRLNGTLATDEPVRHSVITEIDSNGAVVRQWSTKNNVQLEDCLPIPPPQSRAWEYAHINRVQLVSDTDIIVSMRHCSQVWRVNLTTGAVVWRLGKSNSTSEAYRSTLVEFLDDPYGEFCGQHAATLTGAAKLLVFDNGFPCFEVAATAEPERPPNRVTRVAEYTIDATEKAATFERHYSSGGRFDTINPWRGWLDLMDSGNWFITWGAQRRDTNPNSVAAQSESFIEVNPATNEEVFAMRLSAEWERLTPWTHPVPASALSFATSDETAPRPTRVTLDGDVVVVKFHEAVTTNAALAATDFYVTVNGAAVELAAAPQLSGTEVRLTLTASSDGEVTVSYSGTALRDYAPTPNIAAAFGPLQATAIPRSTRPRVGPGSTGGGGGGGGAAADLDVGAAVFVVANGRSPADVGVASVLAARTSRAVVVYTAGEVLSEASRSLLREALPAEVIVVGGVEAVSRDVLVEIRGASPESGTARVSGPDRVATAAVAARRVLGGAADAGPVTLFLANGWSAPDVGASAALAARTRRSAVVYTERGVLPSATAELVRDYQPARVVLVGGTAVIGEGVVDAIAAVAGDANISRITGAGRVDTAALAARRVLGNIAATPDGVTLVIANGWSPPDVGVAATLAAAMENSAVAYTAQGVLPDATAALLRDYRATQVLIVGGTAAVANDVRAAIVEAAPEGASVRRITGDTRAATAASAARRILRNS